MSEAHYGYHKHITAEHDLFDLKLKEVWKYRDLIMLFTKRNFQVRYKQTILGPAWLFITPIISSLIYCFIFGGIAGMSTGETPQLLFYMVGQAAWAFFSGSVTRNASTFTANAGVFGKVYFPRLTTPISNVFTAVAEFGIQMIMILVFIIYYTAVGAIHPNFVCWLILPVTLAHLGMMGMGVGIIISSMTTKYRDLSVLVGFGVSLWMYVTPVIYPMSQVGAGWMRQIIVLNPVTAPMEFCRFAILGDGEIMVGPLIWSWCFTFAVTILGIMLFNKIEKTFMDTV